MYCPKCGKEQPSEHNRFCTGCGFALEGAEKLLAAERMDTTPAAGSSIRKLSPRAKGIWQGIVMFPILFGLFALLIVIYDNIDVGTMDATYSALTLILLLSLMRIVYAIFFEEGKREQQKEVVSSNHRQREISENRSQSSLPVSDTLAAGVQAMSKRTGDLIQAGSVTEHTTRQLGENR
jgi:hypothetical protein